MDGLFNDFENDDITVEDFERLESEAWEKADVLEKNSGDKKTNNNIACLDVTKDRINTTTLNSSNEARSNPSQRTNQIQTGPKQQVADEFQVNYFNKQFQGTQMQQLANQLEEYKLKVEELENSLCMKDGQLKVVKQNLDARRREVTEKENTIVQLRKEQAEERSERNCKLSQEVKKLKTQLSFQKHELMKLETHKIQSQKVSNSQNVSNNDQNVPYSQKDAGPQKVSGSVKRKAEVATTSHGFDLDNSFHDSQMSGCKLPQGKVPRLEEMNDHGKVENVRGRQPKSRERKTSLVCRASTSNMDKPTGTKSLTSYKTNQSSLEKPNTAISLIKTRETTSLKPRETSAENRGSNNQLLEPKIVTPSEKKVCNLVKKLVLSHTCDSGLNDASPDFETMSLLTLLKYPLKHLPEVLKAHSVDANADQSLSQFPTWQTRAADSSDLATDEELDFDSGKYNLVSQGIFLLLGLSNLTEKNVDTLGVIHVLVFLELYITSYLLTKQRTDGHDSKAEARNLCEEGSTHGDSTSESEAQKTSFDEQEMILQTLQILKLLFYSTPDLVKCILDRTSPALFKEDDEVIVVYDSKKAETKEGLEEDENVQVFEENAVGSFRSMLLKNLQKLLVPLSDDKSSLLVCHAALEVVIAMTSLSDNTQLESVFILLNSGCLVDLLAKDDCTMSTVSLVMALITNFLPCKDVHKMLCSHTDDCILLKIYQCACDEEDDGGENWNKFLLQFFQFVMMVGFTHGDSVEFLLESDCQCSFEIIRCLVLVLYDKVKYLLDMVDIEQVISNESLPIVRTGLNLLVILCTHAHYSPDHKLHVEHEFTELIYKSMNLFKNIRPYMPELEALALQDLLDMENVDEIEWSSGSEDNGRDDDDEIIDMVFD
ncbi:Hypothetical predicted protein [Paramuricea clavata]|uniref:Uncharacterized protein n=1 Tax=Paramuricea clavata TaxID=317549 RepID=A0A7D9JBL9_PARCT|nr:Hypothetical predicted protein [Paramuricea clavata]